MRSFGLSCDEDTYRLIQSIPPGIRSKIIRTLVLSHAHEIEEMKEEYWALQLEKKIEVDRLQKERVLHEERMRKEYETAMERSLQQQRRKMALQQEAHEQRIKRIQERAEREVNHWKQSQISAEPLIEVN